MLTPQIAVQSPPRSEAARGHEGGLGQADHSPHAGDHDEGQQDDRDGQALSDGGLRRAGGLEPGGKPVQGVPEQDEQEGQPRPPSARQGHARPMVARRSVLSHRTGLARTVTTDDQPQQDDKHVGHGTGQAVQVGDEPRIGRRVAGYQVLGHPEQDAAYEGDRDRAQTAQDHGSQGAQYHQGEHDGVQTEQRGDENSTQSGQNRREHPGHGRGLGDAHPLQSRQVSSVDHGPHLEAYPGMAQHEPEDPRGDQGCGEHGQLVRGEGDSVHDVHDLGRGRSEAGGRQPLIVRFVANPAGMEDAVADGDDHPLHEVGDGYQQADRSDHLGVDRRFAQPTEE